jgi:signal transduction histidine kinase
MLLRIPIKFFGLVIFVGYTIASHAQSEIFALQLNKLNRDSLNKQILSAEKANDHKKLNALYTGIYLYYFETKYTDSATIYALKAENYAAKSGDSTAYFFNEIKLGELATNAHNFENARTYFEKTISYYQRTGNNKMLFHAYGNLANIFSQSGDAATSATYDRLAADANKNAGDTLGQVILEFERIKTLKDQNKLDEAVALLTKNVALINSAKTFGNGELSRAFWREIHLNFFAECFIQKADYVSAIKYLSDASRYQLPEEFIEQKMVRYYLFSLCYARLHRNDSVAKYIDLLYTQSKEALGNFSPEKLNEINVKYETEKKQRQIADLQQQNQLQLLTVAAQRKLNIAFVVIFLLALASIYFITKNFLQKRKIQAQLEKQKSILEKKQAIETERYRISSELHDDLGGGLSTIRLISEMIKNGKLNGDTDKQLDKISASSKELVQKMNEIVWALNVANDNLQSLVIYIRQFALKFLDDVDIFCKLKVQENIPELVVSGNTRRDIFLLVKEALHNAVKHADASLIQLSVDVDDSLHIIVSDNGKGISNDVLNANNGNGLQNMRKRAEQLQGNLQITNHDGTTITFSVPLSALLHESVID